MATDLSYMQAEKYLAYGVQSVASAQSYCEIFQRKCLSSVVSTASSSIHIGDFIFCNILLPDLQQCRNNGLIDQF